MASLAPFSNLPPLPEVVFYSQTPPTSSFRIDPTQARPSWELARHGAYRTPADFPCRFHQDDTAAAGGSEDTAAAAAAAADGEGVEVYAPGLSANRTFLYKEDEEGGGVMAGRLAGGNSGGPGVGVGDNLSSARRSKGSSASGGSGRSSGPTEGEGGGFWKWGGAAGGDKAKRGGGGGGGSEGKAKVKRKRKPVVLREDGMPDWSVLTNRVDGLAEQAGSFELMCFIDNHDTDTQASLGRGSRVFFEVVV